MATKGRKIRMDEMVDDETKQAARKELRDAQIARDAAMMQAKYPPKVAPVAPAPQMPTPAPQGPGMKKGGKVKKMSGGGSASKRADGIAQRGKTRGKFC